MGLYLDGTSAVQKDIRHEFLAPTLIGLKDEYPKYSIFNDNRILLDKIKKSGYRGVVVNPPFSLPLKHAQNIGLHTHISIAYLKAGASKPLDKLIPRWMDQGFESANLMVGSGFERRDQAFRRVEKILNQATKFDFPVLIETHRGCLTQDVQRTLELIDYFPEIKFTGDFSHWYLTNAIDENTIDDFIKMIEPVLRRICYIQARVSSAHQIQVTDLKGSPDYKNHQKIWRRIFEIFLEQARPGNILPFAPEILPPVFGYGYQVADDKNKLTEPFNRWDQMLEFCAKAESIFQEVKASKIGEVA